MCDVENADEEGGKGSKAKKALRNDKEDLDRRMAIVAWDLFNGSCGGGGTPSGIGLAERLLYEDFQSHGYLDGLDGHDLPSNASSPPTCSNSGQQRLIRSAEESDRGNKRAAWVGGGRSDSARRVVSSTQEVHGVVQRVGSCLTLLRPAIVKGVPTAESGYAASARAG